MPLCEANQKNTLVCKKALGSHHGSHQVAGKHSFSPNICVEFAIQDSCTFVLSMRGTCSEHDNNHPGFCWNEHIFILKSNFVLIAKIIISRLPGLSEKSIAVIGQFVITTANCFGFGTPPPKGCSTVVCWGFGTPLTAA